MKETSYSENNIHNETTIKSDKFLKNEEINIARWPGHAILTAATEALTHVGAVATTIAAYIKPVFNLARQTALRIPEYAGSIIQNSELVNQAANVLTTGFAFTGL